MLITAEQLKEIMPKTAQKGRAEMFIGPLNVAMAWGEINTPKRIRPFLATIAWESTELTRLSEDLYYKDAARILITFDGITPEEAKLCEENPRRLANTVYANEYGNGPFESGDGWRYRARGPIGITYQWNYMACGKALHLPLLENPDLLLIPEHGCKAAAWFWKLNQLNTFADRGDFTGLTKKVNKACDGMKYRLMYLRKCERAIPDA